MSDTLIQGLVGSLFTMLTVIITAWINSRANRKQNNDIKEKVDDYHRQVNGKMERLLDTTKALGNAEGLAEGKAEKKR